MRLIAFSLLATAAFDWPMPFLDRAGVAALGLACLALAIGGGVPRIRRARPFPIPPKRVELPDLAFEPSLEGETWASRYGHAEPAP